jgi:hypothetical protein
MRAGRQHCARCNSFSAIIMCDLPDCFGCGIKSWAKTAMEVSKPYFANQAMMRLFTHKERAIIKNMPVA